MNAIHLKNLLLKLTKSNAKYFKIPNTKQKFSSKGPVYKDISQKKITCE